MNIGKYEKIENIKIWDYIITKGKIINDNELLFEDSIEKVTWISSYYIDNMSPNNYPICIKKDCFGNNIPFEDIWVSQKHRICFNNNFTCISNLINNDTIFIDYSFKNIRYYHLQTNVHNIIDVGGMMSETMDEPEGKNYKSRFNMI